MRIGILTLPFNNNYGGYLGAPVKNCVYNVGLWRKFRIFALTKQY